MPAVRHTEKGREAAGSTAVAQAQHQTIRHASCAFLSAGLTTPGRSVGLKGRMLARDCRPQSWVKLSLKYAIKQVCELCMRFSASNQR